MPASETYKKLMQIKGHVRGAVFQTDAKYIELHYGQEKLDQLKNTLRELGHPIEYENIQTMEWYPLYLRILSFKVMQDLFKWQVEDFVKMGNAAPKYSFIVKLLMKFFISAKTGLHHAPHYWARHYDIGSLKVLDFDEEQRYSVVRLDDFEVEPLYCYYLKGYFERLFAYTLPKHKIKVKETKCMHHGDPYHEFNITWAPEND